MFKLQEEMEVGTDAHAEWVAEVRARARPESSERVPRVRRMATDWVAKWRYDTILRLSRDVRR